MDKFSGLELWKAKKAGTERLRRNPFNDHPTLKDGIFAIYDHHRSGSYLDLSGNGNHGTISGATFTYNGLWRGAYSFDGGDYITLANTNDWKFLHGANDTTGFKWSIVIWVKLSNPQSNTFQTFLDNRGADSANTGILVGFADRSALSEDRNIQCEITRGVSGTSVCSVNISQAYPNDTDWHFIVLTYDQSLASDNMKLYVDNTYIGAETKTADAPSTANPTYTMMFGRANGANLYLTGSMGQTIIYDGVVLSTDNIDYLYNDGEGRPYMGDFFEGLNTLSSCLHSAYPMDETAGAVLLEYFGDIQGAITGATVNQTGLLNKCISFDGNDYITIGTTATYKFLHGANNTTGFKWSINVWVKLDSPTTDTAWIIFGTNGLTGNAAGMGIWIDNRSVVPRTRAIAMLIGARSGQSIVGYVSANSTYPNDSDWNMITFTYDQSLANSNAKLYVNGSYVSDANKSAYIPNTANSDKTPTLCITPGGTTFGMVGDMDVPLFYDGKVLTSTEITYLYNSGRGRKIR
jgi:hypothetical protein